MLLNTKYSYLHTQGRIKCFKGFARGLEIHSKQLGTAGQKDVGQNPAQSWADVTHLSLFLVTKKNFTQV